MSKEPGKTEVIDIKKVAITTCLLTVFLPATAHSVEPDLIKVNNNLQNIFKRMKQKYAEHDVQQAELAAQAEAAKNSLSSNSPSQSFDFASTAATAYPVSDDHFPSPEDDNGSRFTAGEELILTTSVNNLELANIFAIKTNKGLQIGIGDFFQIVEFPIYTDLDSVSAEGWFIKEDNRFALKRLDDGRLEVKANKKTYYVSADDYLVQDDIFIEMEDMERWFNISYQLNEENLALAIRSKDKFPVELRLARLNKREIVGATSNQSVLPLKDSPYRAFSPPLLDIQLSAQENEWVMPANPATPDADPISRRTRNGNYSILANQDLAFLNAELFLAGNDQDSLNNARLTMSRQSDAADLLGPLQATEYAFGDVTPVNAGLGNTLGLSRGFSFGNTPLNQLADNRRVNITGPIQEGWDVELYRNGVLIDQQLGISEGRYEFNDIPLDYGNNDFELLMYGPQGQIESKTESYLVDSNNVLGGQSMYRFSLVEVGKSVFDTDLYVEDPTQEGVMASTVLDYGITDWLAITTGLSAFEPKLGDTQQFYTLGANASLGRVGLLSATYLQSDDDLRSMDLNFRTRWRDTSYGLTARRYEQFNELGEDKLTDQFGFTMSGRLFSTSWLPLSYQNNWQLLEDSQGNRNESVQNSLGMSSRLGYFTNSLIWKNNETADLFTDPTLDSVGERVLGSLQYRKSFGRLHTRLFGGYDVKPVEELTSYGAAFNYSWSPTFNSELRYSHVTYTDDYQLNLGMNWRKDAFTLNTNAGYNENGSWSAGLTLRFSLGYEPIQQTIFSSGRPASQSGAVAVRVFEDLNMNGVFDENERPIENATVKAVQAYRQSKTNESGVAVISSLYNNSTTDIVVDESTLDGPFMIRAIPGVAIKARKGYVDRVDLPVVKAGELEGVIYQKDKDGESVPAPYIMLNLLDKNDKIVASTRSEFDGYYLFTNIKPGAYHLKVDENYVDRRGLKEEQKRLDFSSDGDVIAGVDFVLRPLDEANGFVASAGHFSTPAMLKLYYHLLRNKLGGQFIQTPFYIKQPDKQGYILGLAYFEGNPVTGKAAQLKALEACEKLAPYKIHCEVQYHDFKY